MPDSIATARTLRAFIEDPTGPGRFDAIFEHCFHVARGYLAGLARRGWRLPLDEYNSDHALNDCTQEVIGTLFASRDNQPYYLITDCFRLWVKPETAPEAVASRLYGLIAGHTRQELHRLKASWDGQAANCRRQIRNEMQGDEYEEFDVDGHRVWKWRRARHGLRENKAPVDDGTLCHWIICAANRHTDIPDRCRAVFTEVDADDRVQNFVATWRFLSEMVRVLTDDSDFAPGGLSSPSLAFVRCRLQVLAERAVEDVLNRDFAKLADKRSLCENERSAYTSALRAVMADFIEHGDHDLLPRYLRENLDGCDSKVYLQRHKYIWETTVARCKERLRELLRIEGFDPFAAEASTNRPNGCYIK